MSILATIRALYPECIYRQTPWRRWSLRPHRSNRLWRDLHRPRSHEASQDGSPRMSLRRLKALVMWHNMHAIGFVEMLGGKVACVSCWDRNDKKSYTYSHKEGVDGRFLLSIADQYGTIDRKGRRSWLCGRRWHAMDHEGSGCADPCGDRRSREYRHHQEDVEPCQDRG